MSARLPNLLRKSFPFDRALASWMEAEDAAFADLERRHTAHKQAIEALAERLAGLTQRQKDTPCP